MDLGLVGLLRIYTAETLKYADNYVNKHDSLEAPQRSSLTTPRVVRKLVKAPGSDTDSVFSSPNMVSKTNKDKSPKVVDRRSPRNLATEKKKPTKVSEFQLSRLQDELKKALDQLSSSESQKRKAELDARESRNQLAAISAELEETRNQLNDLSETEDARIQELRKISHDRDRAWQSELEAVQNQHMVESSALASAMNEAQRLKIQLERVSQSAHAEIRCLRAELTETLDLAERMKEQLSDSRENEARAREEAIRTQMEMEEVIRSRMELKSECDGALKSYDSLVLELEESKKKVSSFEEELVGRMLADEIIKITSEDGEICDEELANRKNEFIRILEKAKLEFSQKEAELAAKLEDSKVENEELRTKLIEQENASGFNSKPEQNAPDEKEIQLEIEMRTLELTLMENESRIQGIMEENEMLKHEIKKKDTERSKENDEVLTKLSSLKDEALRSSKQAERVAEELDATQASNSEMEAELRRLKVQSDQWRKAAEAAAAMLSSVDNGKYVERTGLMEYHASGRRLGSYHCDDTTDDEDEWPKKRNGNVLRKIGVLLKKGQK
ncbi:hypothetical protein OROGR_010218 [Orobanche gracilis]